MVKRPSLERLQEIKSALLANPKSEWDSAGYAIAELFAELDAISGAPHDYGKATVMVAQKLNDAIKEELKDSDSQAALDARRELLRLSVQLALDSKYYAEQFDAVLTKTNVRAEEAEKQAALYKEALVRLHSVVKEYYSKMFVSGGDTYEAARRLEAMANFDLQELLIPDAS